MLFLFKWLVLIVLLQKSVIGVWTQFDFVRNKAGSWGSDSHTPFIKYYSNVSLANFGYSVANIGDIDANGVDDIAVGAIGESYYQDSTLIFKAGGLYILLMNSTGELLNATHINGLENGGPSLISGDQFGFSVCGLGDIDGDGIPDIAVGAPGVIVSGVYIMYLNSNATVRDTVLIRGRFEGNTAPTNMTTNATLPVFYNSSDNGPPIRYGSRFGTALANIGDFNNDGMTDMAVSAVEASGGMGFVYLLFLNREGRVLNYTTIGAGVGGGPAISNFYVSFGSAILNVGDLNFDNVTDLAIGAKDMGDASSLNPVSGVVFVCLMNANGTAQHVSRISEYAEQDKGLILPVVSREECGASLASIGDINLDDRRQHRPDMIANPPRRPIPDLVMGCPQGQTGGLPGRIFLAFLNTFGELLDYRALPTQSDAGVAPPLKRLDEFGRGVAGYWDIDNNGLKELIVGAPGDDDGASASGAIYIVFLRRRRYHGPVFNYVRFFLIVTLVPAFCCGLMILGVLYFLWRFRRLPDEVEIIVKKSTLEINPNRKRSRYVKAENQVYAEEYTL